jgi:hypothetical protein
MAVNVSAPPAPSQSGSQPEQAHGLGAALAAYGGVRKATYRYRDAIAPHAAVFGTLAGGYLLHACHVPAWQVLAGEAAAAGAASLFPALRARLARQRWLFGAAGWLPLAAELGAGGPMQTVLVGVGGVLAIPHVWRYRIRIDRPVVKPRRELTSAEKLAISGPDPNVQVWQKKTAGGRRCALPGSVLTDRAPFEFGVRYRIVLDGQTTRDAMDAREQIASDFGLSIDRLYVEETDDGAQNAAELTILTRLAIEDIQHWGGPRLDVKTGIMPVGPYADGRGEACIQLWERNSGPLPTLICGASRVGKSEMVKQVLAELSYADHIIPLYMDPQHGQSAPSWMPYLTDPARGVQEIHERLLMLRDEMYARNKVLATVEWVDEEGEPQTGKQSFDQPGMNGFDLLVGIVDEAHKVLVDDEIAELVQEILAEGSKCGITLILVTQVPTVDELGNGRILSLVTAGNVIVLRTGDAYSARSALQGRIDVHPHLIRKTFPGTTNHTKGTGYVCGYDPRPVLMRGRAVASKWAKQAPKKRLRLLSSDQPAAPRSAPRVDPAPAREAEEIDLDNVVDFTPVSPEQAAEAEQRILRLLDGAAAGLDGSDLSLGTGLHPVIVWRTITDLVARGDVEHADDRYVRVAS